MVSLPDIRACECTWLSPKSANMCTCHNTVLIFMLRTWPFICKKRWNLCEYDATWVRVTTGQQIVLWNTHSLTHTFSLARTQTWRTLYTHSVHQLSVSHDQKTHRLTSWHAYAWLRQTHTHTHSHSHPTPSSHRSLPPTLMHTHSSTPSLSLSLTHTLSPFPPPPPPLYTHTPTPLLSPSTHRRAAASAASGLFKNTWRTL